MRRVEFNDGEGLVFSDLNAIGKLGSRNAGLLSSGLWAESAELRLIQGVTFALSGTELRTITLAAGAYLMPEAAPADDDDTVARVARYAGAAFTVDARTSGAVFRRDIIQARLDTESAGESEARDFKDAVTDVVTSQSVNKRRLSSMTISVKKGTDQATEELANANEPAPDAGYTKIYSILIPDSGDCDETKVWDWHMPLGGGEWWIKPSNSGLYGNAVINLVDTVSIASGARGIVMWSAPDVGRVGKRLLSTEGRFTTHGDAGGADYLIHFSPQPSGSGDGEIAYEWEADLVEGSSVANYTKTFNDKPIWATGLRNRLPTVTATGNAGPLGFTYRMQDSTTANSFQFVRVVYAGS